MVAEKDKNLSILQELKSSLTSVCGASEKEEERAGVRVDAGGARGGERGVVETFCCIELGFAGALRADWQLLEKRTDGFLQK